MLDTPKETLGEGYPLPTDAARKATAPIWSRAFAIHEKAHIGDTKYSSGHILPVRSEEPNSGTPYCDCYMRAWLELHDPIEIEKDKRRECRKELRALIIEKKLRDKLFYAQPEFYERVV